jgi:predicted nucleotidyltransferase
MSNDKKITAEEFLKKLDDASGTTWTESDIDICKAFIEFAKLHVAAALKIASELEETNGTQGYKIYPESILNAYPLDNIK